MATYIVTVRTSLYTDYRVEAEDEQQAKDKAMYGWGQRLHETWGDEPEVAVVEREED